MGEFDCLELEEVSSIDPSWEFIRSRGNTTSLSLHIALIADFDLSKPLSIFSMYGGKSNVSSRNYLS